MLKYLVVLMDDTCPSFCHYENKKTNKNLIPLDTLKKVLRWSMIENLSVQFVLPDYELSAEYKEVMQSVRHQTIATSLNKTSADVIVINDISSSFECDKSYLLRISLNDFIGNVKRIGEVITSCSRMNVAFTDVESFNDNDIERYQNALKEIVDILSESIKTGKQVQTNLLTDRIVLDSMINCNAGWESITVAPDGKFYVCPAYYIDGFGNVGDVENGLDIKNPQLYRLDHAPLCRNCDAYQCKRCIYLNQKLTLEVGIPSHQQCVISHIERNASRILMENLKCEGYFIDNKEIKEIDYLDPFDVESAKK